MRAPEKITQTKVKEGPNDLALTQESAHHSWGNKSCLGAATVVQVSTNMKASE